MPTDSPQPAALDKQADSAVFDREHTTYAAAVQV